ncbi:hypothetical protein [Sessilibacter corallicola]|uniref:hypothetical protein n=1 Tax=Sessilibacter corallicola TaxID=2904075 RepID=UPI001E443EF5|nr:hypothetical protein [Sessilibacter corallicola]MCE2028460.1 hypothetical protein [Sessilibacter corallicola]
MYRYFKLSIVGCLFVVTGCATLEQKRQAIEASLDESERAYLVGKYSTQCKGNSNKTKCAQHFNSISVSFKSTDNDRIWDRLASTQGGFSGNSVYDEVKPELDEKSIYFCRILPEGEYKFYTTSYWNYAGGGSGYSLRKEDYFTVPFSLKAEKITTVDHIKLTTRQGKNLIGLALTLPGQLELKPLSKEELSLAIKKCPVEAHDKPIVQSGLSEKEYSSPFVRSVN